MGGQREDDHDHEQGRGGVPHRRLVPPVRDPLEEITPSVDKHRLPVDQYHKSSMM